MFTQKLPLFKCYWVCWSWFDSVNVYFSTFNVITCICMDPFWGTLFPKHFFPVSGILYRNIWYATMQKINFSLRSQSRRCYNVKTRRCYNVKKQRWIVTSKKLSFSTNIQRQFLTLFQRLSNVNCLLGWNIKDKK